MDKIIRHKGVLAFIRELDGHGTGVIIEVRFPRQSKLIRVVPYHPLLGPDFVFAFAQTCLLNPDTFVRGSRDGIGHGLGIDHIASVHVPGRHTNQIIVVHGPTEEGPKLDPRPIQVACRDRVSQGPFGP